MMRQQYLIGHTLAVLFSGVDERLVQIHHQDQFFVPVESLLIFSSQLFCLLGVNKDSAYNFRKI